MDAALKMSYLIPFNREASFPVSVAVNTDSLQLWIAESNGAKSFSMQPFKMRFGKPTQVLFLFFQDNNLHTLCTFLN